MWFCRKLLRLLWMKLVTNEEVSNKIGTKRKLIFKETAKISGSLIMRKDGSENLKVTGDIKKRDKDKQNSNKCVSVNGW